MATFHGMRKGYEVSETASSDDAPTPQVQPRYSRALRSDSERCVNAMASFSDAPIVCASSDGLRIALGDGEKNISEMWSPAVQMNEFS